MQSKLKELMKKKPHILKDGQNINNLGNMAQVRLVPSWQVENNMRTEKSIEKSNNSGVGCGIV